MAEAALNKKKGQSVGRNDEGIEAQVACFDQNHIWPASFLDFVTAEHNH